MLAPLSENEASPYLLLSKRIDIWQFPLTILPSSAKAILSPDEEERASNFYFAKHQRRFRVARSMLRLILGRYLGENPAHFVFQYNQQGKPWLPHPQAIEFNLSHSAELALLAVGSKYPLGVDLEFFSGRPLTGIAKQLFSPSELKAFLALAPYLKFQAFFQVWAQKEAFIKATGLGLSYPTQEFSVPVLAKEPSPVVDHLTKQDWLIQSFMPKPLCQAALCYHPKVKEIRYFRLQSLAKFGSY